MTTATRAPIEDSVQISQEALPWRVAVVIPAYKVKSHILDVISSIGEEVDRIYVIDDACPEDTGRHVSLNCNDRRVVVLKNNTNEGVGGAVIRGYKQALNDGFSLIVKIDGDGQMDPRLIPSVIAPILAGKADYTKGNRFFTLNSILCIPPARMLGISALSVLTKFSTGYWHVLDPVNGFTAVSSRTLRNIRLEEISKSFFFETHMLFALRAENAMVIDIPMKAKYGCEASNLKIADAIPEFAAKHLLLFCKRFNRPNEILRGRRRK